VGRHVVERSLTGLESHGGFPGFYLATGPVVAFPWLALAAAATAAALRGGAGPRERFAAAWLVGTVAVVELTATRMVHYALPAYPAGVLLAAAWARRGPLRPRWPAAALALGGLALAGVVVAAVAGLGIAGTLAPAAGAAGAIALGAVAGAALLRRRPGAGLAVAACAGVAALVVLTASVLPRVAERTIASRIAAAALEERRGGERLILLHPRDDEAFFLLPLDTGAIRSGAALAAELACGRPALVAARTRDLERAARELPGLRFEVVREVRGVDLGRGGWATATIARVGRGAR
jgi:hypothetical protein